jgi:hypothetical protein
MPGFLYQWPLWIVLILMIGGLVGFALVTLGLVRRFLPGLGFAGHDAHFGDLMVHSMMLIYGLVAALIAVNVYETYSDVSRTVSREATAIAALYRDASGYPEPTHAWVQRAIRDYTLQIINEAWPQQRRGEIPTHGVVMVNQIQQALFSFEPKSEGQKILHAEALRAFNEMALARRLRLDANRERLPGVMWRLLIFGALLCLFAACFFHVDNPRLHQLSLAMLATLMALVLFMIFAWDRPYVGEFGIDSDAYRLVYEQLMHP